MVKSVKRRESVLSRDSAQERAESSPGRGIQEVKRWCLPERPCLGKA